MPPAASTDLSSLAPSSNPLESTSTSKDGKESLVPFHNQKFMEDNYPDLKDKDLGAVYKLHRSYVSSTQNDLSVKPEVKAATAYIHRLQNYRKEIESGGEVSNRLSNLSRTSERTREDLRVQYDEIVVSTSYPHLRDFTFDQIYDFYKEYGRLADSRETDKASSAQRSSYAYIYLLMSRSKAPK